VKYSILIALVAALAAGACSSLAPSDDPRHVVRGPIPSRIQHPLALTFLDMVPRRPVVEGQGEIGATLTSAYSSIFEEHQSATQNVQFDGELWRNSARLRFGMGEGIDLETDIAFLYASGGFLDHFIREFHDVFNFPDQGRETVEDNQFDMRIQSGGDTLYELESNKFGLQDVPLIATFGEATELPDHWNRALRLGIELPWGSDSAGFGNGGMDYGVGACAERSYGRTTHHISGSVVFPSRPEDFIGTGVHVEDIYELVYGFEYRWTDRVSWIAQVDAMSPMIRDIQFDEIDSPIVDFGVGCFRDLEDSSRVFFSFHDDVVSESGPDFTVLVGWTTGL
jgi:hypothetical protein